ncbi:MAG: FAD:protein FMN transferase [Clostridia bacterium]|nr:FAD:protein FMN transferase [Clostridia bacterium]
MKKNVSLLLITVLLVSVLCGCTRPAQPRTQTALAMDTVIRVTVYGQPDDTILTRAMDLCKQYEGIYSATVEDSDVSLLNAAKGKSVSVSAVTLELLGQAQKYYELSGGLFDVTVAPVSKLWDITQDYPVVPKQKSIDKALTKVGFENLTCSFDTLSASLANGAQIDLGGIAKGAVSDHVSDYLRAQGVESAVIDLGGNVYVLGDKNGKPFTVGIAYPFAKEGELLGTVKVCDKAVVTAGIYQRYFRMDDQLYHHIFDPVTGYPAETDLYSATILCDDALQADALSTTCILLGHEKAMELIRSLEGVDAVFITSDEQVYVTPGFTEKYQPDFENEYLEVFQ